MAEKRTSTRARFAGTQLAVAAIITIAAVAGQAAQADAGDDVVERAGAIAQTPPETVATVPEVAVTTAPPQQTATTAPAPTTTAPPPTTTAPPPPAHHHEHEAPPAEPVPAPAPASAQTQESPEERVNRLFPAAVPQAWRDDIAVRFEIIDGSTSWAHGDGRILVGRSHAQADETYLADVLAHEFGHLIAFEYGTRAYVGAAPEGWPEPSWNPAEAWADCVQEVFTGRANPSHGLPPCGDAQLEWALNWLSAGPPQAQGSEGG